MTHTCTKVTVRQRAIRNNRISLYLDYYPAVRNPETMQMSRREYLGIYIYAHPKNEMEREFNNDMLNKAETIRCIRVQSLINEEFGFLDKTKQKADFLAYFKKMCRSKDQKWTFVYQHFYNFVKGQCTFGEVNVDLCKKFREYLLNAKQLKHSNRPISLNSASGYYSTFRGLLKIAYRDKWLRENINDYLDKIEPQDVKKEYPTLDEVKQLAATPCDIPVLKAASLFAYLTGLRISDILNLQWEDFAIAPDLCYSNYGDSVGLRGIIEIITDDNIRKEMWQDWLINHFPYGPTDPNFVLLHFIGKEATFWINGEFSHEKL